MKNILLYWNTIQYLKPVQVYGRILSNIRKHFFCYKTPTNKIIFNSSLNDRKSEFLFHEPWNTAADLSLGFFTFLGIKKKIGVPPNWDLDIDLLWKFNLHYFNWLHLIPREQQKNILSSWISQGRVNSKTAWHPYVTSLRIVSWCKNKVDDKEQISNLYMQANYLYNNLEYFHPANHYLENARALIFAGKYIECDKSNLWINKGLSILEIELPKQILADGAHFELSPMYHCIILEGLLDIINIMGMDSRIELIKNSAFRMLEHLHHIIDSNGHFPLFNDSTYEIAPDPDKLFEYGERIGIWKNQYIPYNNSSLHENQSGIYVIRDENLYIAIDGGIIGPDNIPAHAHADIFNYELKIGKNKFIVDSGVYEYKSGEMRKYSRSTKAHNCLTIDGFDQAEMWGSFRVGRRYKPENVKFGVFGHGYKFSGEFNGFSKLIGGNLMHKREIVYAKETRTVLVSDSVNGLGGHLAETYIHLHPDVKLIKDNDFIKLEKRNDTISLLLHGNRFKVEEGIYSPRFGEKIKNKVIVLSKEVPCSIEYTIEV